MKTMNISTNGKIFPTISILVMKITVKRLLMQYSRRRLDVIMTIIILELTSTIRKTKANNNHDSEGIGQVRIEQKNYKDWIHRYQYNEMNKFFIVPVSDVWLLRGRVGHVKATTNRTLREMKWVIHLSYHHYNPVQIILVMKIWTTPHGVKLRRTNPDLHHLSSFARNKRPNLPHCHHVVMYS